jgi:hypothetical protein
LLCSGGKKTEKQEDLGKKVSAFSPGKTPEEEGADKSLKKVIPVRNNHTNLRTTRRMHSCMQGPML